MSARRWTKRILIGLGGLILLLFVTAAIALMLVDTRAVRDLVAERVEAATGRELAIEGGLEISLFPWLGFELGDTRLANAEGFGERPFAGLERAEMRVRLLPLIVGDITVDRVVIHGLEVNLARDAEGRSNWDDLVAADAGEEAEQAPDADAAEGGGAAAPMALTIAGVEIRDARLRWDDAAAGQRVEVSRLDVTTGALEPGQATPVEVSLRLEPEGGPRLDVSAQTRLTFELAGPRARLADLSVEAEASGETVPGGRAALALAADVDVDAGAGSAEVAGLEITALDRLEVTGNASASFGGDETALDGRLDVAAFDARALAEALELELPATADPEALSRVALGFGLSGGPERLGLEGIEARVDDTRITGTASVAAAEVPRLEADLHADAIDLDRYMPAAADGGTAGADGASGDDAATADPVAALPLEALRGVAAEVAAVIEQARYSGLDLTDVRTKAHLADGILHLDHAGLGIAGGRAELSGRLDGRTDAPALSLTSRVSEVTAEPLLSAFMGDAPIVGGLDATLSADTAGASLDDWTRALDGEVEAIFRDGAIRGFNIARTLRVAKARLSGGEVGTAQAEQQTDFSVMRFVGRIRDGVLSSDTLDLRAPLLRVSGAGEADLAARSLDYTARVLVTGTLEGQGGGAAEELKGLEVPVRLAGAWDAPDVDLRLGEALKGRAKARAKEEVEAEKAEAEQKIEQEKESAEESAKDKVKKELKGLFD